MTTLNPPASAGDVTVPKPTAPPMPRALARRHDWTLAAGLNVTLLRTMIDPHGVQPVYPLDLLVTGLVVGAGTKPVNDLLSRLQNK